MDSARSLPRSLRGRVVGEADRVGAIRREREFTPPGSLRLPPSPFQGRDLGCHGSDAMDDVTAAPSGGLNFDLPEEIRMLKDTVRRFVDRELIPIERTCRDGHKLKREVRAQLAAQRQGAWSRRLRRAGRVRRPRHGPRRQGDGVGRTLAQHRAAVAGRATSSVRTSARSSITSTTSRKRSTCCRPSAASSTGAWRKRSPTPAAIPAACAPPPFATATTMSSTA